MGFLKKITQRSFFLKVNLIESTSILIRLKRYAEISAVSSSIKFS